MISTNAFVFPIFFILASLVIIFTTKNKKISTWIGDFPSKEHVLPILFITLQLLAVGIGTDYLATALNVNDTQNVTTVIQGIQSNPIVGVVSTALGAVGEELFFRGILLTVVGPFISSIIFGLFHAGYDSIIQILGSFVAGLVLCRARIKYGSLFPGVVGHFLYNILIIFIWRS